ncbi:MAG: GGDEF domain-containing protein [Pirellula sp.]
MNSMPLLYLLMGLLFGTTLLAIGMALGFWFAKRAGGMDPSFAAKFVDEQQQMLSVMRGMASWTTDFAGDFTRYQSTMQNLSRTASDGKSVRTKEEVQKLLEQIVQANSLLQTRLETAEQKLESQTKQIAGYLTEARTDGLTELPNRRSFDQKLDACYAQWQQEKHCFSLALIDIDHFKQINDTFGHPAGDAVLKSVAALLREIKNDSLLVARYGGEEFAVLFDGDDKSAAAIIEGLRLSIAEHQFQADGHLIPVTISAGVARVMGDERIGKLVRRSDEALYSAKMGGRNRVYVHNGILSELFGKPTADRTIASNASEPNDRPPNTNELEHRVLSRLDSLISQEANRAD